MQAAPHDLRRIALVLRCTQEIITNAVRHAGARNLWIHARRVDGGIAIDARDDGTGADAVVPGHGLRGMRERLAQHGGALEVQCRPGEGFHLRLVLPLGTGPLCVPVAIVPTGGEPIEPSPSTDGTTPRGAVA